MQLLNWSRRGETIDENDDEQTIHSVKARGYSTVGWAVNAIAQLVKQGETIDENDDEYTIHPVKARGYSAVGWAVNNIAQLVKEKRGEE